MKLPSEREVRAAMDRLKTFEKDNRVELVRLIKKFGEGGFELARSYTETQAQYFDRVRDMIREQ